MPYDKKEYERTIRRRKAMERLGLLVDYEGPLTDRGLPKALGDWILHKWRNDDRILASQKWARLLDAINSSPEVAERELKVATGEDELTVIERRTLYLLSLGFAPKQIATFDEVSEFAIKERLRRARTALGANNTTHAVAMAIRRDLLWH